MPWEQRACHTKGLVATSHCPRGWQILSLEPRTGWTGSVVSSIRSPLGSGPSQWQRLLGVRNDCMCLGTQLWEGPRTSVWCFKSGQKIPPVEHYCCLVAKSCPTLCKSPWTTVRQASVLHYLPEFAQTHIHWVGDAIQPSHPLFPPSPPAFSLSQHQGLFQWDGSSHQVAKVLEPQH